MTATMEGMSAAALIEEQVPAPPRAVKHWTHRSAGPTYGEWLRSAPDDQLTKGERRARETERAWEAANPEAVTELDLLVGVIVRLVKARRTLAEDIQGHVPFTKNLPKVYPEGMRLRVTARFGSLLQGRTADGIPLLLRPEWVERGGLLGGRSEQKQAERCEVPDPVVLDGVAEDRPEDRA